VKNTSCVVSLLLLLQKPITGDVVVVFLRGMRLSLPTVHFVPRGGGGGYSLIILII
jgi:hypothetical protein